MGGVAICNREIYPFASTLCAIRSSRKNMFDHPIYDALAVITAFVAMGLQQLPPQCLRSSENPAFTHVSACPWKQFNRVVAMACSGVEGHA
jgi:hypothetical protein